MGSAELEAVPVPKLPDFEGVHRPRTVSDMDGVASEASELQPVIRAVDRSGSRRASMSSEADKGGTSRRESTFSEASVMSGTPSWTPTEREKQKYAALFKRIDTDDDGYVLGAEVKDVMEKSKLPVELLGKAWE